MPHMAGMHIILFTPPMSQANGNVISQVVAQVPLALVVQVSTGHRHPPISTPQYSSPPRSIFQATRTSTSILIPKQRFSTSALNWSFLSPAIPQWTWIHSWSIHLQCTTKPPACCRFSQMATSPTGLPIRSISHLSSTLFRCMSDSVTRQPTALPAVPGFSIISTQPPHSLPLPITIICWHRLKSHSLPGTAMMQ